MSKRSLSRGGWIALGLLVLAAATYTLVRRLDSSVLLPVSYAVIAQPPGDLPVMPEKPPPGSAGYGDCPPEGQGGDPQLNLLKNRVDKAGYVAVSFDSIRALTWPKNVERRGMRDWSPSNRAYMSQFLGLPVVVEGYLVTMREGGADAASCDRSDEANPYWRLYFAKNPRDDRLESVVAVSTPQTRIGHTWTADLIRSFLIDGHWKVRLSGWLYFDPDHPQDVGRTRATMWEISPVMQIEVFQDGRWNPLDKYGK